MTRARPGFLFGCLVLGYAFLYIPMLVLIAYSFNDSRLVSVWGGFSLRWYGELFRSREIIEATLLSLQVALVSATFATVLGTLAALALSRWGRFRGRLLLSGMVAAPLVMPEIITGLALLLLFVSLQQVIGWPGGRGALTITIAHITFSLAFVTVVVQSRLAMLDESLEEAAMDLGGRPLRVLFDVTLPLIAPAMLSGWLLAFTLSLDDLVITSFVSGPGSTTLPLLIFSKVRLGVTPDINALATIIMLVVAIAVGISGWLMFRQEKQKMLPAGE